jgi:hypothetical protein
MSVAPSPASARSCAFALVVASSAIASKVLRATCDASGAGGYWVHVGAARVAQVHGESRAVDKRAPGDCRGGERK